MTINEPVSVGLVNNTPKYVIWKGENYTISNIGLHHLFREGRVLYHVFSVLTGTVFMRLRLNTDNLSWRLEEISDSDV